MTKSSIILLVGIVIMIVIGAAVWYSTGGNAANALLTSNPVATPIETVSSSISQTTTIIVSASGTPTSGPMIPGEPTPEY